ncbi:hypothetical protein V3F56_09150 [Moorellaceae bacterium AZ2]
MGLRYRYNGEISDSVGLLISILVRYPEIGTINYEPGARILKFSFMLAGRVSKKDLEEFRQRFVKSLATFNLLEHREAQVISLEYHCFEQLTVLEVQRDVETLSQGEIDLIMTLVRQQFGESLVADVNENMQEEDLLVQEEIIDHMLESIKGEATQKKLIAFREEGRVLVFNKQK